MSGFTYYVPGLSGVRAEDLVAGLPEPLRAVFRGHVPAFRGCESGPDGGKGQAVKAAEHGNGYFPDRQDWTDTGDGYWIGWTPGDLPGPEDLKRPTMLDGQEIQLADGRIWRIPAAPYLPRKLVIEGKALVPGPDVLDDYRPLHEAAQRFWTIIGVGAEGAEVTMEYSELAEVATIALSGNYRIGFQEIGRLGLLTTENVVPVCKALVDWTARLEMIEDAVETSGAEQDPKDDAAHQGGE